MPYTYPWGSSESWDLKKKNGKILQVELPEESSGYI